MNKYLMKDIKAKTGALRDVHIGILGRECTVAIFNNAVFHYVNREGVLMSVYTSFVLDVKQDDKTLIIETMNTTYELEKL